MLRQQRQAVKPQAKRMSACYYSALVTSQRRQRISGSGSRALSIIAATTTTNNQQPLLCMHDTQPCIRVAGVTDVMQRTKDFVAVRQLAGTHIHTCMLTYIYILVYKPIKPCNCNYIVLHRSTLLLFLRSMNHRSL